MPSLSVNRRVGSTTTKSKELLMSLHMQQTNDLMIRSEDR